MFHQPPAPDELTKGEQLWILKKESQMVQIVGGGPRQAAGKMPGGYFEPVPCSLFLEANSGERVQEGHISLEHWEPLWSMWLQAEEKDLLSSLGKEERENRASPGDYCI